MNTLLGVEAGASRFIRREKEVTADQTVEKTKLLADNIPKPLKFTDCMRAFMQSKTVRILAIATVGALIAAFSLSPIGLPFLIAGVAVSALALITLCIIHRKEIVFEFAAIMRMAQTKADTFNQIGDYPIFLGGLPNQMASDFSKMQKKEIGAVLSVMEDWEMKPMGLSRPYTAEQYKKAYGENSVHQISFKDHKLLTPEVMNEAADFIKQQVDAGKKVYVHCRGGVGRSATAVASYLMKYEGKTIEEVQMIIKDSRPTSTIKNKVKALQDFQVYLETKKSKA